MLFPITTEANRAMSQLESLAITFYFLQARKKSLVQGAIGFGFGFACHWLKNWREIFKPTTMRSNRNGEITFDSYLISAVLIWIKHVSHRTSHNLTPNLQNINEAL